MINRLSKLRQPSSFERFYSVKIDFVIG